MMINLHDLDLPILNYAVWYSYSLAGILIFCVVRSPNIEVVLFLSRIIILITV